jgi:glycosyltransferase involved in cell wall biosynthesis
VAFFEEIPPSEIPGLYAQCHVGLVALDPRHKTHNIPGKFLSYMQSGIPVLASINPGNDLETLILQEQVGQVCVDAAPETLQRMAETLVDSLTTDRALGTRCKKLAKRLFSPDAAVRQIIAGLKA